MRFINNWRCVFISVNSWNHTLCEFGNKRKSQAFLFSMRPGDHISGTYKRLFCLWIRDHALITELSLGSCLDFSQMRIIIFLIKGMRCHWLSEWGGDHSWWKTGWVMLYMEDWYPQFPNVGRCARTGVLLHGSVTFFLPITLTSSHLHTCLPTHAHAGHSCIGFGHLESHERRMWQTQSSRCYSWARELF